jgi:hypothetical protein
MKAWLRRLLAVLRGDAVYVSRDYLARLHARVDQADRRALAQRKSRAERAALANPNPEQPQ